MVLYVTEMGAIGDGSALNTKAINDAITAVSEAGGGQVIVPPGIFLSGSIVLKNNVHLYMEPGSKITGCDNPAAYNKGALVYGDHADNVGIEGYGIIEINQRFEEDERPFVVIMRKCTNVTLRGISLYDQGGYFVSYCDQCTNVTIDRVVIESRDCDNGDGIDFSGSRNVTISNCKVRAGDDAIGLKTHDPEGPCENFTITNCILNSNWAGLRIGPETCGDMINITVSNCVFNDCSDGIKLQLCENYRMEKIVFSNLVMVNVCRSVVMTCNSYPMSSKSAGVRPPLGSFKDILFDNIIMKTGGRAPHQRYFEEMFVLHGFPTAPISDVMFSNICFRTAGGKTYNDDEKGILVPDLLDHYRSYPEFMPHGRDDFPSACMYIKNAENLRFMNCTFDTEEPDGRTAIVAENVKGMKMFAASSSVSGGLLRYYNVTGLSMTCCEGDVIEVTGEDAKRCDELQAITLKMEKQIADNAAIVDKIKKMPILTKIMIDEDSDALTYAFTHDYDEGERYLDLGVLKGSPKVTINDVEIYDWNRNECRSYSDRLPIALEITPFLKSGENCITVSLYGRNAGYRSSAIYVRKG